MKRQMLDFPSTHPLTNILALMNVGFFTNEFFLSCLIDLTHISYHDHLVLNKSDYVANWANFWAFQAQSTVIAQHLQGFLAVSKLKDELKKANDSLVSPLFAHIALVGDNLKLKACVIALELKSKGLETRTMNIKDSAKLSAEEVQRLITSLALVEKEKDVEKKGKTQIEQKAYDDVNEVHVSIFHHFFRQVLFHYEVLDE